MPFTASDAKGHTKKANTAKRQRMWSHVANSTRRKLLKQGLSEKAADARAIRAANSAVGGLHG